MTTAPRRSSAKPHAIKRQAFNDPNQPILRDLFLLQSWRDHPLIELEAWLKQQGRRESTIAVYKSMFNVFLEHLAAKSRSIDQCTENDIETFLVEKSVERSRTGKPTRQRKQYLLLLRRLFAHLATVGREAKNNPARDAARTEELRDNRGQDNPTRFLTAEETQRLIRTLEVRLDELRKEQKSVEEQWLDYRDLGLVAATLGGGLKVADLERLTLNCMSLPDRVIDLSKPNQAHRARLLPFAVAPLQAWLDVQAALPVNAGMDLATHPVFQSDRSGGGVRPSGNRRPFMHASSIHRRVHALLVSAGITGDRACAQTLRNTYGALLIDSGASDNELIDFLGLRLPLTAQRFRATYHHFLHTRGLAKVGALTFEGNESCETIDAGR